MNNLLNQLKAYFYVRSSSSKDKRGIFYVRVTIGGKFLTSAVKSLELYSHEFDQKNQNPKQSCSMYMEVSDFMLRMKQELYYIHKDYEKQRKVFTKEDLKESVQKVYNRLNNLNTTNTKTLLNVFNEFLEVQSEKIDRLISQGTYDCRENYMIKTKSTLISLKLHNMPILNFGKKECEKLLSVLVKNNNKNYVARLMSVVNMVFKYAKKEGYIFTNPYDEVERIKIDKAPNLFWLEQDEIARMMELKLEGRTKGLRDAFVFCCYTGLSIGDYELLNPKRARIIIEEAKSPKDIQSGKIVIVGGRQVLIGKRRKTGTLYRVPLPAQALHIIEEYGELSKLPFSLYSNGQVLNLIGKQAGIENTLRFHTARKSFANYLLNIVRMDTFFVKDIMGWIKIEEANPYIRVSNDTLAAQVL